MCTWVELPGRRLCPIPEDIWWRPPWPSFRRLHRRTFRLHRRGHWWRKRPARPSSPAKLGWPANKRRSDGSAGCCWTFSLGWGGSRWECVWRDEIAVQDDSLDASSAHLIYLCLCRCCWIDAAAQFQAADTAHLLLLLWRLLLRRNNKCKLMRFPSLFSRSLSRLVTLCFC